MDLTLSNCYEYIANLHEEVTDLLGPGVRFRVDKAASLYTAAPRPRLHTDLNLPYGQIF